jgi:radical SAM protein with 4Fe4S-binding SPASM domain
LRYIVVNMSVNQGFEFFVQWHLTERCNLRCRHCYQTGGKVGEIGLPEAGKVIDHVADTLKAWEEAYDIAFLPSFNVTGGEPFLREDIFQVLERIGTGGFDTYILSNGILIDRDKAKRLSDLSVKGVQVSLEGPENIHDTIRGKGSFAGALKGVSHLLEAGIVVTLNVTLSTVNADHFQEMINLASHAGVQRLGFSRLVPSGRGKQMLATMLDAERVRELYEKIFSAPLAELAIVTGDPLALHFDSPALEGEAGTIPVGGCAAGVSGLTLLADGTITPCRRLAVPVGNILRDSLRELWATSPVLESLRDRSKYAGKCGTCRRWANCRGCRAIAYSYSQSRGQPDFLAEDPQCFL